MQNEAPPKPGSVTQTTPTNIAVESYETRLQTANGHKNLASEKLRSFLEAIKAKKTRKTRKQAEEEQRLRDELARATQNVEAIEKKEEQRLRDELARATQNVEAIEKTAENSSFQGDAELRVTPVELFENAAFKREVLEQMMPPQQLTDDKKTDRLNTISQRVQIDVDMLDLNTPSKLNGSAMADAAMGAELADAGISMTRDLVNDLDTTKEPIQATICDAAVERPHNTSVGEPTGAGIYADMGLERPQEATVCQAKVDAVIGLECPKLTMFDNHAQDNVGITVTSDSVDDTNVNRAAGAQFDIAITDGRSLVATAMPSDLTLDENAETALGTASEGTNDTNVNTAAETEVNADMGEERSLFATLDKPAESEVRIAVTLDGLNDASVNEHPRPEDDAQMLHDQPHIATVNKPTEADIRPYRILNDGLNDAHTTTKVNEDASANVGAKLRLYDRGVGNSGFDSEFNGLGINPMFNIPYDQLSSLISLEDDFLPDTNFQSSQPLTPQATVVQLMSRQEANIKRKYELQASKNITFDSNALRSIDHEMHQLDEELKRIRLQVEEAVVYLALGGNLPHLPQDQVPHQDHGLGDALLWGDEKKHVPESTEENVHAAEIVASTARDDALPDNHAEEYEMLSAQIAALVTTKLGLKNTHRLNKQALMKSEDSSLRRDKEAAEEKIKTITKDIARLKGRRRRLLEPKATPKLPVKNESTIAIPAPRPSKRKRVDSPATHASSSVADPSGNLPDASGKKSAPAPTRPPETVMNMEVEEQEHSDAESLAYFKYTEAEKAAFETAARIDIKNFLADTTGNYRISSRVCKTIRVVQTFIPEASYTTRALAEHVHINMQGKTKCRYHEKTKNYNWYDGRTDAPHLVYGAPYQYVPGAADPPAADCMHCGCLIDEVLLDFYFWKTWTVTSRNPNYYGRDEGMGDGYMVPRIRAFVGQSYQRKTLSKVDDIYSLDYGSIAYRRREWITQAKRALIMANYLAPPGLKCSLVIPDDANINADDADINADNANINFNDADINADDTDRLGLALE